MHPNPVPHHAREEARLAALDRYDVLDTPPEEAFDRITRLVRRLLDVPISTLTFIDGHRQWFKSCQGLGAPETPRGPAFCNVAIGRCAPLVVADAAEDPRFADNPFVTGEPHVRFYAGVPLCGPDGHNIGTLCAVDTRPREIAPEQLEALVDLAQVAMDELELRLLAATDGLTGALSRRAFRDEAGRAVALARRHRHDLSCLVFDLDRFKAVNDTHGHPVGDAVLAAAVASCRAVLRESDPIGRLGGEEFAVLLPQTGRTAALQVAEKLRAAIAGSSVAGPAGLIQATASFGVASLDRMVGDVDELLRRADQALYAAKEAGRDRCRLWEAPNAPISPTQRRRVLKAGRISFNGGHSTVDCTVRSLSETGAGLDLISTAGIPEQFKLAIESDGLHRLCRVAEKRERRLEVEFA